MNAAQLHCLVLQRARHAPRNLAYSLFSRLNGVYVLFSQLEVILSAVL